MVGFKRLLDMVVAGGLLVVCGPILAVAALLIWLEDRGNPLFLQARTGLGGRTFTIYKLRTMYVHTTAATEMGQVGGGHPLVSNVGFWLRRLKLDELPQLWNILVGDMSLIGPRPNLPEHAAEFTPFQQRRWEAPPGLTGWAQVHGGVRLSWEDRIRLDVWYIDHHSPTLDLLILWRTVGVVVWGEQPNAEVVAAAREYAAPRETSKQAVAIRRAA